MNNLENVIYEIKENHKLNKLAKNGIIRKTPNIDFSEHDISANLSFNKYNEIIKSFEKDLLSNFSKDSSSLFYKNLETLKIEDSKLATLFTKECFYAMYDDKKNKIKIVLKKNDDYETLKSSTTHELLHMSSRKNREFGGLAQAFKGKMVGLGLDEGYTELLNQRYFDKKINENFYFYERSFASGIEKIVGKEVMQNCYFNADLLTIIKKITQYTGNIQETADLIVEMDYLNKIKIPDLKEHAAFNIRLKIANIYKEKLDLELKCGLIDRNEYEKKKFLHVDEFTKSNTTYSIDAKIEELNRVYMINDNGQIHYLKKSKFPIHFTPDANQVEKEPTASSLVNEKIEDKSSNIIEKKSL